MATREMDFLLRIHVKAEDADTDPRWVKRELVRHLAGAHGNHDGYSVFSTSNGAFEVTHANGSGNWGVADAAIKLLEGQVKSDLEGTPEFEPRMAELAALRHRLGPKPL